MTSNSTEFGRYIATLAPRCATIYVPTALISFVNWPSSYSTTSSLPRIVNIFPGDPIVFSSSPFGPLTACFHTSRRSPSLPLVHFGVPGSFTLSPVLSGYPWGVSMDLYIADSPGYRTGEVEDCRARRKVWTSGSGVKNKGYMR